MAVFSQRGSAERGALAHPQSQWGWGAMAFGLRVVSGSASRIRRIQHASWPALPKVASRGREGRVETNATQKHVGSSAVVYRWVMEGAERAQKEGAHFAHPRKA